MEISAKQISEILNGELIGNGNVLVSNISKIEEGEKGTLSFIANPKYEKFLYTTESSIVLINKTLEVAKEIDPTIIKVDDAYKSFADLLDFYQQSKIKDKSGIHKLAYVDESSTIGENVLVDASAYIGENCTIGNNTKIHPQVYIGDNVRIGNNVILHPGVKIYHECVIKDNCIFHAGAVIGSDGFGFAPQEGDDYKKIPQIGNVIVEENVEIGANTTVDRATMGSTIIKRGVKLDNLVQIAHNAIIGENTVMAAQSGISGSSSIGKNCMIGGQVGITGHISITDGVKVAAQSGIGKEMKIENEIVQGSPSFNIRDYQKSYVYFRKLPDMNNRISEIEKQLKKL